MEKFKKYFKKSISYKLYLLFKRNIQSFFTMLGEIMQQGFFTLKYILTNQINYGELIEQSNRFGITSLPITLSVVGMTSVIVAMQVAGEMVKQGAGNYVGMLVALLIVREVGVIMSGFGIISMIGSSMASELATMRVTEQLDAMKVLSVDPVRYLFVPRVLAGTIMMPFVLIVSSLVGVAAGAVASYCVSELSFKAFFDSVWFGITLHDMNVSLAKAVIFGFTITLISCTCGFNAHGGAKGVGLATTRAVVWSFVAIVIWDMLFAMAFFF